MRCTFWSKAETERLKKFRKRRFAIFQIACALNRSEASVEMKIRRLSRKDELSVRPQIYDDGFDFQYIDRELLLKAIIIWLCEGTKQSGHNRCVEVVNSDPRIIKTFIRFLRAIKINEKNPFKT